MQRELTDISRRLLATCMTRQRAAAAGVFQQAPSLHAAPAAARRMPLGCSTRCGEKGCGCSIGSPAIRGLRRTMSLVESRSIRIRLGPQMLEVLEDRTIVRTYSVSRWT